MTVAGRYAAAIVAAAGIAAVVIAALGGGREAWLALALSLGVQVPLGAWLVGSVGRPAFLAVWVMGMLGRLALVGLAGLVLVPAFALRAEPLLVPLALLLMVFVLLEGVVLMVQHSRVGVR